jgi:hypothetical protein
MSDLVQRLRDAFVPSAGAQLTYLLEEAAARIAALEAENARLRDIEEMLRMYIAGHVHELPPVNDSVRTPT